MFARIHNEVNFAGASIVGIVVDPQILNGFQLLADILLRKSALEFNKEVISIQQGALAEPRHAPKQSHIHDKQLERL